MLFSYAQKGKKHSIQGKKKRVVFLCYAFFPSVKIEDFKSIGRKTKRGTLLKSSILKEGEGS